MSKSMGNIISPEDILKNYGADVESLVAASDYAGFRNRQKYIKSTCRVMKNKKHF